MILRKADSNVKAPDFEPIDDCHYSADAHLQLLNKRNSVNYVFYFILILLGCVIVYGFIH